MSESNKIVVWELIPNQYERTILLVLSQESFYDTISLLNEKHNFGWAEGEDYSKDTDINHPCTITNDDNNMIAIILRSYTQCRKDYTTLAHEIYHVMTHIAKETGAVMSPACSEHWAYFLSFYMDICIACLDEHLAILASDSNNL